MMMYFIFISGPLTAGVDLSIGRDARTNAEIESNVRRAVEAANALTRLGLFPFVPHLCAGVPAQWWDQTLTDEDRMRWCFAWLRRCDALLRLPGASRNADREEIEARALGLPVFHDLSSLAVHVTANQKGGSRT